MHASVNPKKNNRRARRAYLGPPSPSERRDRRPSAARRRPSATCHADAPGYPRAAVAPGLPAGAPNPDAPLGRGRRRTRPARRPPRSPCAAVRPWICAARGRERDGEGERVEGESAGGGREVGEERRALAAKCGGDGEGEREAERNESKP